MSTYRLLSRSVKYFIFLSVSTAADALLPFTMDSLCSRRRNGLEYVCLAGYTRSAFVSGLTTCRLDLDRKDDKHGQFSKLNSCLYFEKRFVLMKLCGKYSFCPFVLINLGLWVPVLCRIVTTGVIVA